MSQNRKMPIKEDIVIYWLDDLLNKYGKYWLDGIYDECDIHESQIISRCHAKKVAHICFACGSEAGTERCHISPRQLSNNDDVSNLHLLCKECHLESECLDNESIYFAWFNQKSPMSSGSALRLLNKAMLYEQLIRQGKNDLLPDYLRCYI